MHSIVISTSDWLNLTFINIDILPGAFYPGHSTMPDDSSFIQSPIHPRIPQVRDKKEDLEKGMFVSFNKNNPSKSNEIYLIFSFFWKVKSLNISSSSVEG